MKHLGVLEAAGLVVVRRQGRERWNHLNGVPLRRVYERWMRPHADRAATGLLRLQEHVEARVEEAAMDEVQPGGMLRQIEQEVVVAAPRERVFAALTDEVGTWWAHRFRDGSEVRLEARLGGRFYEDWGDGEGVTYAVVTRLARPEALVVQGPMGMPGAVFGVIGYTLTDEGDGTRVALSHEVLGAMGDEREASYRQGWRSLLDEHLRRWVEDGVPVELSGAR
jgi:uncharacterized protein YndB with AHSA1/START domain